MSLTSSTSPPHADLPTRQPTVRVWHAKSRSVRLIIGGLACAVVVAVLVYRQSMPPWMIPSALSTSRPILVRGDDKALRHLVLKGPSPEYPSASLARHVTGVVVATVTLGIDGHLKSVTIVESPDIETGRAVRDAVGRWTFRSLDVPSRASVITGNMIFYFRLVGGRGVVLSPEELQAIDRPTARDTRPQVEPVAKTISEVDFRNLPSTISTVVVDIRSRAAHVQRHREGAINIPLRELATRNKAELPRSGYVVIDCFPEHQHSGQCGIAAHVLAANGFSSVAILNRGRD